MSIQLKKLAILDETSGKQFISKDGKTRQVYKEKPITVNVDGGQKIINGYDYQVSISGVFSKTDKEFLTSLSSKEAKVMIAGYTSSGFILQGYGKIYADDSAFVIKTKGQASCSDTKCEMCFDKDMSCGKDGFDSLPFYFPFNQPLEMTFTYKSGGMIVVEQSDVKGKSLSLEMYEVPDLGRHAFKSTKSIEIETLDDRCFINVDRESVHADNLSIVIK